MLLKLYSFLLLSSFSMQLIQAMDQEILTCPLPLKNLCADVVAREVDKQLPRIDSHKNLQKAYAILETPMFKKFTEFPEIHVLIAKAYQKLHSSELLLGSKTLKGHNRPVSSVAYSPDGSQVASCSGDPDIRVWGLISGQCIQTLQGHNERIIVYSPDGMQLASVSLDRTIKIWDLKTNTCINTLIGHSSYITSIAYSSDGAQLASGSLNGTIEIWDLQFGNCMQTLQGHNMCVKSVAYSPNGNQLASGSFDNTIRIWDPVSGNCIHILQGHDDHVNSVAYSPDGSQVASGSGDNTIRIWDIGTGTCIHILQGHKYLVYSVAYSPDGSQLVSGALDSTIRIWDPAYGNCLHILHGHNGVVSSVAYSPDGSQVAYGSRDKTIRIWESYNQNPETIEDVLFSLLSSFYITNKPEKKIKLLINLCNSNEYKKLSDTHKQAFTSYIRRYATEHPNSPVKELVKIIKQQNADKLVKQNEERGLQILFHK